MRLERRKTVKSVGTIFLIPKLLSVTEKNIIIIQDSMKWYLLTGEERKDKLTAPRENSKMVWSCNLLANYVDIYNLLV